MRAALYSRVSTEDQARHGISIEAQLAALRAWAKRENHTIVDEYIDAGISGKTPPGKRPALSRLFADLEAGAKIDILAFCKLDRFFRSVKLYYQAMDVLGRYHVAWQAIQEDYETVTASGRMKVNIMLSVAENEADRTSERIKAVFEHKVSKGEAITRCQPFGFELRDKRVVHSEYAPAAREAFEMFAATGNTYAVRNMIQEKYGVRLPYEVCYRFLQNPLYTGRYRDNDNYCEPIVSKELFEKIQADFAERRKTKKAPSGRVYLFSGLLKCGICGRRMTACASSSTLHPEHYRCNGHQFGRTCTNNHTIAEHIIEKALIENIPAQIEAIEIKIAQQKKPPAIDRAAIEKRLERLKDLYIDGDIDKLTYQSRREKLSAQLAEQTDTSRNAVDSLRQIIGSTFNADYLTMDKLARRAVWRSIIDHITISPCGQLDIFFNGIVY